MCSDHFYILHHIVYVAQIRRGANPRTVTEKFEVSAGEEEILVDDGYLTVKVDTMFRTVHH